MRCSGDISKVAVPDGAVNREHSGATKDLLSGLRQRSSSLPIRE